MVSAGHAAVRQDALLATVDADEAARWRSRREPDLAPLWDILESVMDPELPMLSIWELGILRGLRVESDGTVEVRITPTYSACPAIAAIAEDIAVALRRHGHRKLRVVTQLSPAWRTAWISADARRRLAAHGIAPPGNADGAVRCVHCGSLDTECVSAYGSAACQAVFRCAACREMFPHFKSF